MKNIKKTVFIFLVFVTSFSYCQNAEEYLTRGLSKDDLKDYNNSSFMGEVIDYSAFNGSSTSTALIGVGIGAVLGIIGIVVINKMKK